VFLGNGNGTFQPPITYAAGTSPNSVAVGDFNGNGHEDLVVADRGDFSGRGSGVSVLMGNGDGSFQAPRSFPAGASPRAVTVGDFNGDGSLDLAVTNFDPFGTVSVLLGNGDGSFRTSQSYTVGSFPLAIAVSDVNQDGRLDLMTTTDGAVNVLLGNGNGTFQGAQSYAIASSGEYMAVADFNGDGYPDIAVANYGSDLVTLSLNAANWGDRSTPALRSSDRRPRPMPLDQLVADPASPPLAGRDAFTADSEPSAYVSATPDLPQSSARQVSVASHPHRGRSTSSNGIQRTASTLAPETTEGSSKSLKSLTSPSRSVFTPP
jgi:hypothetical protein